MKYQIKHYDSENTIENIATFMEREAKIGWEVVSISAQKDLGMLVVYKRLVAPSK